MEEYEEKPERALESGRDTRPNRIKHGENSGPMKKGFRRPKPGKESEPTRHLCVIGVGPAHDDELRDACVSFGKVLGFDHHQKNPGIRIVTYDCVEVAMAAKEALVEALTERFGRQIPVCYVSPLETKPPESLKCASDSASVVVPGLTLLKEFLSAAEESQLLQHFLEVDAQWTGPLRRRVQHYGRIFDYRTRHVDFDTKAPPLPECLREVLSRMAGMNLKPISPDQLTLNEYKPGQGISPHVDTHSAFEDGLASLSMGSGCVMDLRHPDGVGMKSVYLPRGSLLVMEGSARYEWSHGIANRKTDMVDGVLLKRSTRISLTFRRVRNPAEPCCCDFEACCDRYTPVARATYI